MKIKSLVMVAAAVSVAMLTGCSSNHFAAGSSTQTSVTLTRGNYRMVAPGSLGDSHGFKFLGIIPFAKATESKARHNLWVDFFETHKDMKGKPLALINTTPPDKSTIYLILFSLPKVTTQADIIEYTDQTVNAPPAVTSAPVSPPVQSPPAHASLPPVEKTSALGGGEITLFPPPTTQ